MRLLVAEDDLWIRDFLVRVLTSAGHQTVAVARGDHALMELMGGLYNVAILDIQMPAMNAIDVARAYRPLGLHTALVILTANAAASRELNCAELGIRQVLTKPVNTKQLLDAITDSATAQPGRTVAPTAPGMADHAALHSQRMADLLRVYGGEAGVQVALARFGAQLAIASDNIERAMADGRFEDVRQHAHRIAGGAGTLGAIRLEALGAKLSTSEDAMEAMALARQLQQEIAQFNEQGWPIK